MISDRLNVWSERERGPKLVGRRREKEAGQMPEGINASPVYREGGGIVAVVPASLALNLDVLWAQTWHPNARPDRAQAG
jgi:predicted CoA-binding protein